MERIPSSHYLGINHLDWQRYGIMSVILARKDLQVQVIMEANFLNESVADPTKTVFVEDGDIYLPSFSETRWV